MSAPPVRQEFEALLAEAVEAQLDAEEAYDRARKAKPDQVMWSQRFHDLLEQARAARETEVGDG